MKQCLVALEALSLFKQLHRNPSFVGMWENPWFLYLFLSHTVYFIESKD